MSILDSRKMPKKVFGIIHFNRYHASVFLQDTHTPVIISHQSEPKPQRKFSASGRRQWSRLVGCYPRSPQLEARTHHYYCWKLLLVTFYPPVSLSLSLCGAPLLAVSLFLHWMAADHCCRYWLLWAVCLHMLSAMLVTVSVLWKL